MFGIFSKREFFFWWLMEMVTFSENVLSCLWCISGRALNLHSSSLCTAVTGQVWSGWIPAPSGSDVASPWAGSAGEVVDEVMLMSWMISAPLELILPRLFHSALECGLRFASFLSSASWRRQSECRPCCWSTDALWLLLVLNGHCSWLIC